MGTNRSRRTRKSLKAVPLTPGQLHYLATGELTDFSAFLICPGHNLEADRKEFAAIRAAFEPGAFPWAEKEFGKAAPDGNE